MQDFSMLKGVSNELNWIKKNKNKEFSIIKCWIGDEDAEMDFYSLTKQHDRLAMRGWNKLFRHKNLKT